MHHVLYDWPFVGLVLACVLLAFAWRSPRTVPATTSRWRDPAFVLRLVWPMYLVHQFEEHGIDALGRHFAFLADLCAMLGHPDLAVCPGDAAFVFAVNVIACPIAFSLPLFWGTTRPARAAFGWSIPLVNAITHIGAAVARGHYNPGLLTSVVLFVPLGGWMLFVMLRTGAIRRAQVPLLFVAGGVVHAVLIGSLLAHERGWIGHTALLVINGVNGVVPWALASGVPEEASRVPARVTVSR